MGAGEEGGGGSEEKAGELHFDFDGKALWERGEYVGISLYFKYKYG